MTRRRRSMMNENEDEDGIQMLVTIHNASTVLCQYWGK